MTYLFELYEEEFQKRTSLIQIWLGMRQNNDEDPPFFELSRCETLICDMKIEANQQRNPEKQNLLSRLELYVVQLHSLQRHCPQSESDKLLAKVPEGEKKGRLFTDLANQLSWISDAKETKSKEKGADIQGEISTLHSGLSGAVDSLIPNRKIIMKTPKKSSQTSREDRLPRRNFFNGITDRVRWKSVSSSGQVKKDNDKEKIIEQQLPTSFPTKYDLIDAASKLVEFGKFPFKNFGKRPMQEDDDCWNDDHSVENDSPQKMSHNGQNI